MILNIGCPVIVGGKVSIECFVDSLNIDLVEKVFSTR